MIPANKLLGQNFLRCSWVASTMIKAADLSVSDTVLEVGAGSGILTEELVKHAGKIIAVEKDKNLVVRYLKPLSDEHKNLEVVSGDILKNFSEISENYKLKTINYKLISNIPYYLTSRLLRVLLEQGPRPETIVLTIQKEVAERICAQPPKMNPVTFQWSSQLHRNDKNLPRQTHDKAAEFQKCNGMNLLALSVQAFGKPEIIKTVPADCFWPKPKVASAIIQIDGISDDFFTENKIKPEFFFKMLKTAFAGKRKMLVNTLAGLMGDKDKVKKALLSANLSEKSRPEELGLENWLSVHKSVYNS